MRVQLALAIALTAGVSVAHAQGLGSESEGKVAAAPGAQAKAATGAPAGKAGAAPAQPKGGAQPKPAGSAAQQPKAQAPAQPGKPAVATAQAKTANAQPGAAGNAAAGKAPVAPIDEEAEYKANVQLVTARAYLVQENLPAAAIEPLTNFLALHPDHFQARLMRGYAYGRIGRYADAEADYQAALDVMTGTSADEVLLRAQELSFMKQREVALIVLDDGIRRLGPLPNLESAALRLEVALGRNDDAVRRIKGMLSRTKRKEMLYVKLADILEANGRPDQAIDARRQAVLAIDALPESERVGKVKRIRDDLVYRINRASRGSTW